MKFLRRTELIHYRKKQSNVLSIIGLAAFKAIALSKMSLLLSAMMMMGKFGKGGGGHGGPWQSSGGGHGGGTIILFNLLFNVF